MERNRHSITLLFYRYIDDILIVTNETIEDINIYLEKAKCNDININIDPTISLSVHFLDITITNEDGRLRTSVYHKITSEPYILPYRSDHPRHIHRNVPYAALLQAARICSNVDDFNRERARLDMSLLLNGYPPDFISKQFNRFFQTNNAMPVLNQRKQCSYDCLHQKLLYQSTRREKQLQMMMEDPVRRPFVLQPKIWNQQEMYPRYLFDSGLTVPMSRLFYRWWKKYYGFAGSPLQNINIQLIAKTNHTLETFFIHKKPNKELLTRRDTL